MQNNKYNTSEHIKMNHAEYSFNISSFKSFYRIYIWLPYLILTIAFFIMIVYAAISDVETGHKVGLIITYVISYFLSVLLLFISQVIIRLLVFHIERINYNSLAILEKLTEICDQKKENINKEDKTNTDISLEADYILSKNGLENMINDKIIDDKRFNLYINILKTLNNYNNCNDLIEEYKNKYSNIKKDNSVLSLDDGLKQKLDLLLKEKRINDNQYNEYMSLIEKINEYKDEQQIILYKKIIDVLNTY